MKKRRINVDKVIRTLREVEVLQGQGMTVSECCPKIGIADHTYYRWKKEYGGPNRDQAVPTGHIWECHFFRTHYYAVSKSFEAFTRLVPRIAPASPSGSRPCRSFGASGCPGWVGRRPHSSLGDKTPEEFAQGTDFASLCQPPDLNRKMALLH